MTKELVSGETQRRRIDAMSRLFTKSDSVLAGKHISVKVADKAGHVAAPSWTDGKTITFNGDMIGDVNTVEDIIRVTGLNYHELAHVLYTPRPNRPIVQVVQAEGMFNAFNLLEDQRIETFLTAQYPSTIPYLVSTFMRFCLMHDRSWEANFVLMYGRRYLPADVRAEFRRRFRRQDLIPQFEEIIDRYRKLVFPADETEAVTLIRDYHALLVEMGKTGQQAIDPNGHSEGQRPPINEGRPVPQDEQQQAADNSDALDQALDDSGDSDDSSNGGGNSVDANDDADTTSAPADADGDADTVDDSFDGDGDSSDSDDDAKAGQTQAGGSDKSDSESVPTDTNAVPTNGQGNSGQPDLQPQQPDPSMSDADLRDMMDEIAKAFEDMPEVQEEVSNAQKSIVQGDGDVSSGYDADSAFPELDTWGEDAQAVRAFSRQLERLRADADPGWHTHQQSGRLNVKRAIEGGSLDRLFDRWDEGYGEVADIECVVLLDVSGSMRSQIDQAARAMWTVKRAMETIDAGVTVFGYGSHTVKVYDRHEKAKPGKYKAVTTNGATYPRAAIKEALHILTTTQRDNRICIIITDGVWDNDPATHRDPYTPDDLIALMNEQGITTALAGIGQYGLAAHNCQVAVEITSSADLVGFAKQIVSQTMKKGK